MTASLVYCTTPSRDDALAIARTVVGERLAACANILNGMTSVYHWQGDLQQEEEAVLLLKTEVSLVARLIDRVRALHRYECPAILAWEIAAGNPAYLSWLAEETAAAREASSEAAPE